MKICLIYPGVGVGGFKSVRPGEANWIHHGVGSIGASLKEVGHEVTLIDLRNEESWISMLDKIGVYDPEIVGVSVSYMDLKPATKALELIKQNYPEIITVVGGLCPTLFPDKFLTNDNVDHIITHEGEISMRELVDDLASGEKRERLIHGVKPELDTLPYVDRELFNYPKELGCGFAPGQRLPSITMISGRGCPYNCSYCQPAEKITYGSKVRMRSVENVIGELRRLKKDYMFNSITFWDDTFTFNKKWIGEFCEKYHKAGFNEKITACSRADIICNNEDMIERLVEVGLEWLVIGFESGSDRMLKFLNKGVTLEQNYKAAEICKKLGVKVFGTFMLGLPTETKEEQLETATMINIIQPDHTSLFYFTPIPGTDIYDYCSQNDLMIREDEMNIERTNSYSPKIKNTDYKYLDKIRDRLCLV